MTNFKSLLEGKSIVVIDDDLLPRKMMENILHQAGCKVYTAKDVFEGWYLIKTEFPDAIILDIAMPYVDGITFCEYVRHNPATRSLPCLFLSSETTPNNIKKIAQLGAVSLLAKQSVTSEIVFDKLTKIFQQ